jgi:hypothetical protein
MIRVTINSDFSIQSYYYVELVGFSANTLHKNGIIPRIAASGTSAAGAAFETGCFN